VLFLDELPEFDRAALEALRQPIEEGSIVLSRASGTIELPARFQLVAAMNPCPCGHLGDRRRACRCTPREIARYRGRISGPILDRIDLHLDVPVPEPEDLHRHGGGLPSESMAREVRVARDVQGARYGSATQLNASVSDRVLRSHLSLDEPARQLLFEASRKLRLSARAGVRLLRVARTIADIRGGRGVDRSDLAEALQYRLAGVSEQ
jgi:magnesium chelatase family protein